MYPKLRIEYRYLDGKWEWCHTSGFPFIVKEGDEFDIFIEGEIPKHLPIPGEFVFMSMKEENWHWCHEGWLTSEEYWKKHWSDEEGVREYD